MIRRWSSSTSGLHASPDAHADTAASDVDLAAASGSTEEQTTAYTQRTGSEAGSARVVVGAAASAHQQIGRYTLLRKLGEGGMGVVFTAHDHELDRRVALKLVPGAAASGPWSGRVQREAQALARLSHPNVVQIHDVGVIDGQLFLAMEYVQGETLASWQAGRDPSAALGRRQIIDMYIQAGRGLRAAHEKGLVHRDFKPQNVIVGGDGRARVLDFGLAAARAGPGPGGSDAALRLPGVLEMTLTLPGTVMGTPRYMAPEQHRAEASDARTDQFSFCVALYEALYREHPFARGDAEASARALLAGDIGPPPPGSKVPAWLRAVLLRGLSRVPDLRHPDMGALLEALARDPIARRRRRRRLVGAFSLVAALSVALVLGGLRGRAWWQERAREEAARGRLAALEERVAILDAVGEHELARRAFEAFIERPELRGTRALGRAWLAEAARLKARDQADAAIEALALAYSLATAREDQARALVELARAFVEQRRLSALIRVVATLEARFADEVDDAERTALQLHAAYARRDLLGAARLLEGPRATRAIAVARALAHGTRTAHDEGFMSARVIDLDGDGAPELLLRPTGGRDAPLVRATPELPQVASSPAARRTLALDPGGEPGLVLTWTAAGETSDAALARFVGGAREEVLRWREGAPLATLSHDLDGDGDRELLIGTGPYTRRVLEVIEEDGRAALRSPAPSLDRRASDVVDLLAADLDDDGRVELVAVLGPWIAYEVRVLRHDPATDTYVDVARRRLGSIDDAVIVRRAGAPPEIAVYRSHLLESPAAFPKERPRGEERGLYRLALRDDALEVVSFSPERAPTGSYRELMAGDLDGDGDDELILGHVGGGGGEPVYGVIEVFASGEVDGAPLMTLSGAMPVHVGDLDGDGDAELVAVIHEQDGDRVWTLGSGEQPLPVARDEPITPPEDALEGAPDRMRRRVQELADMGLDQAAGDVLERVAEMVEEPGDRARLLVAAADQHERRALDRRAARLYARAAREPGVAVEASLGAARALLRLGAHAEALAALAGLEGRRLDDEDARALAVLRAELEAMRSRAVVTRFDRPLVGDWQLAQPRAMQRDRVAGTLRVDALTRGPLLSRAVTWDGRRIELALELDVRRVEWGSALHFHLTSGPGDRWADAVISVTGVGGGGERALEVVCAGTGVLDSTRVPIESGARMVGSPRLRVYHVIDRARGESICSVIHGDDEPVDLRSKLGDTPLGDAYRLELFADYASPAWLSADIHRLEARGVEVAEGEPPRSPVASRLVDGDLVGALGALEADTPADLRFAVLSRLGRAEVAREVLREALASEGFAAVRPWLVEALHTRWPESQGVIREVVSPEQRAELIAEAWGQALASEPGDGAAAQALHGGLTDLELGAAPTPRDVERLLLRASAAARLGLDEDARVDLEAVLAALEGSPRVEDPEGEPGWRARTGEQARLDHALACARSGDPAAARRSLEALLASAASPENVEDEIAASPELSRIRDTR